MLPLPSLGALRLSNTWVPQNPSQVATAIYIIIMAFYMFLTCMWSGCLSLLSKVAGFGSLTTSIADILRTVCTDVGIKKTTLTPSVVVGQNITYQIVL